MASLDSRINRLEEIASQLEQGAYTMPTALGPNKLSKNTIKGKSITGVMIDANDLSAVKTNTGSLTVTGALTIGTGGSLQSGKTAYTDTANAGYFIGLDSGTPKIRVGNIGHTKGFVWDGTDLTIIGGITATTGTIGGWVIGSTDLTSDTGATGIASSGSYRLWIGNSTPASAVFSVTSAGAFKAESGTIGGWTIDSINGLKLGTTTTTRGISTGSTAFYAGNATPSSAPFRVTTSGTLVASDATITGSITANSGSIGGLTIGASSITSSGWSITSAGVMTSTSGTIGGLTINTSDITVPSGKKIKFGTSAGDYLADNILHFEVGTGSTGKIEFKNGASAAYGQIYGYSGATNGSCSISGINGNRSAVFLPNASTTDAGTYAEAAAYDSTGSLAARAVVYADGNIELKLGDSSGSDQIKILDSGNAQVFGINSDGKMGLPGADTTAAGTYAGRVPVSWNGGNYYVHVFNA